MITAEAFLVSASSIQSHFTGSCSSCLSQDEATESSPACLSTDIYACLHPPQPCPLLFTWSILLAILHLDQAGLCHQALLKAKFPEFS